MAAGRNLSIYNNDIIVVRYHRTDKPISPASLADDFQYDGLCKLLSDGKEVGQCDLLYHGRRTFVPPGPDIIDLQTELINSWGDILDFFAVKFIVIKNRETGEKYLDYNYETEAGKIGPNGCRKIIEPGLLGIQPISGSAGDIATFIIDSADQIEYDLIIGGVSSNVNVSSSQ